MTPKYFFLNFNLNTCTTLQDISCFAFYPSLQCVSKTCVAHTFTALHVTSLGVNVRGHTGPAVKLGWRVSACSEPPTLTTSTRHGAVPPLTPLCPVAMDCKQSPGYYSNSYCKTILQPHCFQPLTMGL